MKTFLPLLAATLLLPPVLSQCGQGCLRCSSDSSQCLFCDHPLGYILRDSKCVQLNPANCLAFDSRGNCLVCNSNSYLSISTNSCQTLRDADVIPNCAQYSPSITCLFCRAGYSLVNSVCVAVSQPIYNCATYAPGGASCLVCAYKFFRTPGGERCDALDKSTGCLTGSYIGCYGCANGFNFNPIYKRQTLFKSILALSSPTIVVKGQTVTGSNTTATPTATPTTASTTVVVTGPLRNGYPDESLVNYWNNLILGMSSGSFTDVCEPSTVVNCDNASSAQICKGCSKGFYLDDSGICQPVPQMQIPNCINYYSATVCSECANMYFLSNKFTCIPVNEITNCTKYDGTAFTSTCVKCDKGLYTFQNMCIQRSYQNITHCTQLQDRFDGCGACDTGYRLTNDFLSCLPDIPNCVSFEPSSLNTVALTCNACDIGFYLSAGNCTNGTIANCYIYDLNSNVCVVCTDKYYVKDGSCVLATSLVGCQVYSNVMADTCQSCENGSFLFSIKRSCSQIITVDNCVSYSNAQTCNLCANGFQLTADNKCALIPVAENCLQKDPVLATCILCTNGYFLKNGVCVRHLSYQLLNCLTIQNSGIDSIFSCLTCKDYNTNLNYASEPVCVSANEIAKPFIGNCSIHSYNVDALGTSIVCTACLPGFYLKNDGTACLTACPDSTPIILETLLTANSIIGPMCDSAVDANVAESYIIEGTKYIHKCRNTSITYHTQDTQPLRFVVTDKGITKNFTYSLRNNVVQCDATPASTVLLFYPGNTTKDARCDLWIKVDTKYYCKRCALGYTGNVLADGNVNYVTCSTVIAGCDASVAYGNLDKRTFGLTYKLSTIFSCHKCYRNDKIPVAFITSAGEYNPFNINSNIPSVDAGDKLSPMIQCLAPIPEDLKIPKEIFLATVPMNCALLVSFVDKAKNFPSLDDATSTLQCVECKPGFRAIRNPGQTFVKSCVPIDFCDSVSFINLVSGCSKCQAGFTWQITEDVNNLKWSNEYCVPLKDLNCLFAIKDYCMACKPGYVLNKDNRCDSFSTPLCANQNYLDDGFTTQYNSKPIDDIISFRQFVLPFPSGCRKCTGSFMPVLWTEVGRRFEACTGSTYITEGLFSIATKYTLNCKNYGTTNDVCVTCEQNYILSDDSKFCVAQSAFPFCQTVSVTNKICTTCQPGFVLVGGYCEKPIIPFCQTYKKSDTIQLCDVCSDGYRLDTNTCIPGSILNCKTYDNSGFCKACLDSYVMVGTKGSRYCIALDASLNCVAADENISTSQTAIQCNRCKDGYSYKPVETSKQICLRLNQINGCLQYDNKELLALSTFTCLSCNETFYLATPWSCMPRTYFVGNCSKYEINYDFCSVCAPNFYLTNNRTCVPYPTGIYGCELYAGLKNCTQCQAGMYLVSPTECRVIDTGLLIPNCQVYKKVGTCSQCMMNFILTDNTCIPSIAQNCKTYVSTLACDTCPDGFGFQPNQATMAIDCVVMNNPYCAVFNNYYPFDCIECQNFFYALNGKCFSITTFIANCLAYSSPYLCSRCEMGYILNREQTDCIESSSFGISTNSCSDLRYARNVLCTECTLGYFPSNITGKCESCTNGYYQGCAICNQTNTSICELCITGFYHSNGNCFAWNNTVVLPPSQPRNPQTNTTTTNNTKPTTDVEILKALMVLVFAFGALMTM